MSRVFDDRSDRGWLTLWIKSPADFCRIEALIVKSYHYSPFRWAQFLSHGVVDEQLVIQ